MQIRRSNGWWLVLLAVVACQNQAIAAPPSDSEPGDSIKRGELLARAHCATCHLFPPPGALDRRTWKEQTLPRMKMRVGLAPEALSRQRDAEVLRQTSGFLKAPAMTASDFDTIVAYYLARAPEEMPPGAPRVAIEVGLPGFRVERPRFRHAVPLTSAVAVDAERREILMGDAGRQVLSVLNSEGEEIQTVNVGNVPVQFLRRGGELWMTMIGSFLPSERRLGAYSRWEREGRGWREGAVVLSGLARTTDVERADLNGDGREDLVVCQYGNNVGHFSWFEQRPDAGYEEHVLIQKTGAIRAVVRDMNGDHRPDITVLFAQETEALMILTNKGGGVFGPPRVVLQRAPVFGHTGFEYADFDGDGTPELLVTNGDNGEYPSPHKWYHGIRIFADRGERFQEITFFPMHGAFRAMARDFDLDGDLDIAAISYYPDYGRTVEEGFVYLENVGAGRFRPRTIREHAVGRWLVMDAGDVDGDGDDDLVLGSHVHGPTDVPDGLMLEWEKSGPSVLLLRNLAKP